MRNRPHVVEEFGVNGPFLVLAPKALADDLRAAFRHRLLQSEPLPARHHIAQALVGRAIFIGRRRGGAKPAFIDAAAVEAKGVEVVGMQFEPFARLEKGARHPAWGQAEQAAAIFQRGINQRSNFRFDCFEGRDVVHAVVFSRFRCVHASHRNRNISRLQPESWRARAGGSRCARRLPGLGTARTRR